MKMTILKLSLWMVLILALIPTSEGNRYSVYKIVTGAMQDLGNFCSRTPETCQHTQNAFFSLKDKANYIGSTVYGVFTSSDLKTAAIDNPDDGMNQAVNTKTQENETDMTEDNYQDKPLRHKKPVSYQYSQKASQDTLNQTDRAAEWVEPALESSKNGRI